MIHHHHSVRRRGFTLVELLVTVGVIVFLVGITVAAGRVAYTASAKHKTRIVLDLLDLAASEWESNAERQLTWWDATGPDPQEAYGMRDVHGDLDDMLILTEILQTYSRVPPVQSILAQIDDSLVYEYAAGVYPRWIESDVAREQMDERFEGSITILDSWGTPIYATHPGRPFDPDDGGYADADGTLRTYNEIAYGVASDRRIRFVSAGPDRTFGMMLPIGEEHDAATDNLYSYPVQPLSPY